MFEWLAVPDCLPRHEVDIVYVPAYGLVWNKSRLTAINTACVKAAVCQAGKKSKVVFSCAYPILEDLEGNARKSLAIASGLDENRIILFKDIGNSYEEVLKLLEIYGNLEAKNILIVAERFHLPRVISSLRLMKPDVQLYWLSISAPFEIAREPSVIKSVRMGFKILWILWNVLLYPLTPYFLKSAKPASSHR